MSPQLNAQQLAAAIRSVEARRDAKQIEVDALVKLQSLAGFIAPALVSSFQDFSEQTTPQQCRAKLEEAMTMYLHGKINWLLIDLQEIELQLRMLKQAQSGIVLAVPRS